MHKNASIPRRLPCYTNIAAVSLFETPIWLSCRHMKTLNSLYRLVTIQTIAKPFRLFCPMVLCARLLFLSPLFTELVSRIKARMGVTTKDPGVTQRTRQQLGHFQSTDTQFPNLSRLVEKLLTQWNSSDFDREGAALRSTHRFRSVRVRLVNAL